MTGRYLFTKFGKLIIIISNLIGLFPRKIRIKLYKHYKRVDSVKGILFRYCILRKLVKRIGTNVYVGIGVDIENFENLEIGNNVSIHSYSYINAIGGVYIGNEVSIARATSIISFNHGYSDAKKPIKYNDIIKGKIVISDDVWIGARVTILANVNIFKRSIIAAGAVVTKNVESNTLVGGVPAKFIKKIGVEKK